MPPSTTSTAASSITTASSSSFSSVQGHGITHSICPILLLLTATAVLYYTLPLAMTGPDHGLVVQAGLLALVAWVVACKCYRLRGGEEALPLALVTTLPLLSSAVVLFTLSRTHR